MKPLCFLLYGNTTNTVRVNEQQGLSIFLSVPKSIIELVVLLSTNLFSSQYFQEVMRILCVPMFINEMRSNPTSVLVGFDISFVYFQNLKQNTHIVHYN